jgi:hypothetical protein
MKVEHLYVMYVDPLSIGRICMDIDNSRVTWDLDKTCGSTNAVVTEIPIQIQPP